MRSELCCSLCDSFSDLEYRLYYQHNPERLSTCPVTIHALLHIVDGLEATGPAWTAWAFPMERYCGHLQRSIKNRRFPYPSIDEFVVNDGRLSHLKLRYDMVDELAFKKPLDSGVNIPGCECMIFYEVAILSWMNDR